MDNTRKRCSAMAIAVAINTLLVALRFRVYGLTGSAAVLADALESIVNIFASAFGLYAVWLSNRRDDAHPFGHPKIESASAALEGTLISGAACAILYATTLGRPITGGVVGIAPYAGVAAATLVLAWWLLRQGGKLDSSAISADGRHALVDAVTAFGVIASLVLVRLTGNPIIDTMAASILGAWIFLEGWGLLRESIPRLVLEGGK